MLSEYERRVLNEIETSLARVERERRARVVAVLRAVRLSLVLAALAALVCLVLLGVVPAPVAVGPVAALGAVIGWLACTAFGRRGIGLRLRARSRRRRLPPSG